MRLNEYKPVPARHPESSRILNAGPPDHNEIQAVLGWGPVRVVSPSRIQDLLRRTFPLNFYGRTVPQAQPAR